MECENIPHNLWKGGIAVTIFLSELLGTATFIFFGVGTNCANGLRKSYAKGTGWVFIALGWGIAVLMGALVAGPSGGHLNPALTIALAVDGSVAWADVPAYICGEMLGAIVGASLAYLLYVLQFKEQNGEGGTVGYFATGPAIDNKPINFLSELIATFFLVFAIKVIGTQDVVAGIGSLFVTLLIIVLGIATGSVTGYALNPARDLGPRIAHFLLPIPGKGSNNWGYALIPILGPIAGAVIAVLTFAAFNIW